MSPRRLLLACAPLLVLALVWIGFGLASAWVNRDAMDPWGFFSYRTAARILAQTAGVAVAACGMTLVIVAAGIDLAVGSVIALTCVVTALGLAQGWHPLLAGLLAVLVGAGTGAFTGTLVAGLRLMPFIVTLGMLGMARGAAKGLAGSQAVNYDADAHPLFAQLMRPFVSGPDGSFWFALTHHPHRLVAPGVWIAAALVAVTAIVLRCSVFGRHLQAIGSNEAAARLCGIRVAAVKVWMYVLCGACAGLAGVLETARISQGDPTTAGGRELDVIAAVVIGGASLGGGAGSVVGAAIGALVMTVLRAGSQNLGWDTWVQEVIIGAVIVAAVAVDRFRPRAR